MTLENRKKWLAHYRRVGNADAEKDLLAKYPDTENSEEKEKSKKSK